MKSNAELGSLAGLALAFVLILAVPSIPLIACPFLGVGATMLGWVVGAAADRQ